MGASGWHSRSGAYRGSQSPVASRSMPEVWLPYGGVEVAVDIRAENLGGTLAPPASVLDAEQLRQKVRNVPLHPQVVLLSVTPGILALILALLSAWSEQGGAGVTVSCGRPEFGRLRKAMEGSPAVAALLSEPRTEVGAAQSRKLLAPTELTQRNTLLVSEVDFDPLFGFGGGPVALCRLLWPEVIGEAFLAAGTSEPQPAADTPAAKLTQEYAAFALDLPTLEILATNGSVHDFTEGTLASAHTQAAARLVGGMRIAIPAPARAVLAAAGPMADGRLRTALRAFWNVLGGLRHEGSGALLAECTEGLGGVAFEEFVAGRLQPAHALRQGRYYEGLEDLVYLQTAQQRHDLILVSTLPLLFAQRRLGFRVARKANQALELILAKQGARAKVYLVPRAAGTLLRTE